MDIYGERSEDDMDEWPDVSTPTEKQQRSLGSKAET
jgi:hypothetical protein